MTALVLLSGGQDSVFCLMRAMEDDCEVSCIGFDYGQLHKKELDYASGLCNSLDVPFKTVDVRFLQELGMSSLTRNGESPFVTNRNALFLTVGHAEAQVIGANRLYAGFCQTDFNGFTDCREEFLQAFVASLNLGYNATIELVTPLLFKTKSEMLEEAERKGFMNNLLNAVTCYKGSDIINEWGNGCGTCPSCEQRRKGWESFIQQKLITMTED